MTETKIIVIDDDPTGSQTVHSCLLLTQWDEKTIKAALLDDSPLFFILSNTRAMTAGQAGDITREICQNISRALHSLENEAVHINPMIVSRSDSTLRGHYPVETDIIAEELGPFDAHFLVPAFFEGGRVTRDSVHYLLIGGELVPVDQTEFARDSVFAFSTAFLPDYVEEKTAGKIQAGNVERFLLNDLTADCRPRLQGLVNNSCCVVDADQQDDLNQFASQLKQQAAQGKRFLFRSAASLLTAFAQLPPQPVASNEMARYVRNDQPGVILVGSHVNKTSQQLSHLLEHTDISSVLVDVQKLRDMGYDLESPAVTEYRDELIGQIKQLHQAGDNLVIYTTREELSFPDQQERLVFGQRLSDFLMQIVNRLPETIGFLISKGGITSNDVLSTGLALHESRVVGQILPGCSVVLCPAEHARFAGLPVVIFPGNVGDESSITSAFQILTGSIDERQHDQRKTA